MRWPVVFGNLGRVLRLWSIPLAVPVLAAFLMEPRDASLLGLAVPSNALAFATTSLGSLSLGLLLELLGDRSDLREAEAYVLVGMGWLVAAVIGAVPFATTGVLTHPVDALFETMSGMTTTGYTVIPIPLEEVAPSIHMWRGLLQWLGGMGIVVLTIAVLPGLATSGARLMQAEVPGEEVERLVPRIEETARLLWIVYAGLTFVGIVLIWPIFTFDVGLSAGQAFFEAIFHTFTAIATGGFSTRSASLAAFSSPALEWVLILVMIVGGANFALHFHWLRGRLGPILKDEEFRFYTVALLVGSAAVFTTLWAVPATGSLWADLPGKEVLGALRIAMMQMVSASLNAGFTTADYTTWPSVARFLIFFAMFLGGCIGSTGGSIKVGRVLVAFKMLIADLRRILHPRAVVPVTLSGTLVDSKMLRRLMAFLFLYLAFFLAGTVLLLATTQLDIFGAASWAAGSLGNVGASFGGLPPSFDYAAMPAVAKTGMLTLMWLGRLELFAVFVLFAPATYR